MLVVTLEEAQARLPELLDELKPGDVAQITRNGHAVARLERQADPSAQPIVPGFAKDLVVRIADDFDAPLEEFKEYME